MAQGLAHEWTLVMNGQRLPLLIGGGIVTLVIITVAVVVLAGDRTAVDFAEDTPEGALQRYLRAFDDGDLEAAYAYFSADVRADMDREAYERTVAMYAPGIGVDRTRRALFDGRLGEGDSIRLQVTVEEIYGDGLSASSNRYQREVRMVRENGGWRIDEPLVWLEPSPVEPAR